MLNMCLNTVSRHEIGTPMQLSVCLNSVLNVKALVGTFNQEKALVGAFSVIMTTDGSFAALVATLHHDSPTSANFLLKSPLIFLSIL